MIARLLLKRIFERIGLTTREVALRVEFADGSVFENRPANKTSDLGIRFLTRHAEWYTLLNFHEGLFESYNKRRRRFGRRTADRRARKVGS